MFGSRKIVSHKPETERREKSAATDAEEKKVKEKRATPRKMSERQSNRKVTFENIIAYLNSLDCREVAVSSVADMLDDVYVWMYMDSDKQIRLPVSRPGVEVKKMMPEGSRVYSRRDDNAIVGDESERLDRNVDVDAVSVVSSNLGGGAVKVQPVTREYLNFPVDPARSQQSYQDPIPGSLSNETNTAFGGTLDWQQTSSGSTLDWPRPSFTHRPKATYPLGFMPPTPEEPAEEAVESMYRGPRRMSISRLHNSQAITTVPETPPPPMEAARAKKTKMVKVRRPAVETVGE